MITLTIRGCGDLCNESSFTENSFVSIIQLPKSSGYPRSVIKGLDRTHTWMPLIANGGSER